MNILNLKPSFKVVEVNNLAGLRMGHVLAQTPAAVAEIAHTTWGEQDVLENGVIVELAATNKLVNFVDGQPLLVFNEELLDGSHVGLDQQGEAFEDGEVYPRAIGLYTGDTFTTNNVDVNGITAENCFAIPVAGVLTLQALAAGANFIAEKTTMPNGKIGYKFTYLGHVA